MENTEQVGITLSEILPSITAEVTAELRRRAVERFQWATAEAVGKEVQTYIAEKIIPEVAKELAAKEAEIKGAIVAGITGACLDAAAAIRAAMTKKLTGFEGDKVIGALLEPLVPKRY